MAERFLADSVSYAAAGRTIIRDISLSLTQGELLALIGPTVPGNRRC